MQEVLVRHTTAAGVVRRDDGCVMVTGDVDGGAAVGIPREDRYHPERSWVEGERSVVGGWLPLGAVSAEVVDDRGARVVAAVANGAWYQLHGDPEPARPSHHKSHHTAHRQPSPPPEIPKVESSQAADSAPNS